ncbi:hypothetical protein LINPERPRIM_LOCUS4264 [Linum perenne]
MASTAKSKLTTSTKRRKSLHQRRCRRRHRKYIESLELSKSSTSSDQIFYGNVRCKRCRQLAELKLQSKPDDDEYVCPDDDFYDDEELRLRVIHYRRTLDLNGVCCVNSQTERILSFHKA